MVNSPDSQPSDPEVGTTDRMTTPAFDCEGWAHREPAADPGAVAALSAASGIDLPERYLALLLLSNGGGGPLGVEPGWFQLWPAEKVLDLNRG